MCRGVRATVRGIAEWTPLIVAGMHQAGSGLATRLLAELGVDLDGAQNGSLRSQSAISALHDRLLERACPSDDPGVSRWGWTESEQLDVCAIEAVAGDVAAYVAALRDDAGGASGFAEPRAALLLEMWAHAAPAAIFVLAYRAPWDVACDVLSIELPELEDHPDYAARVWLRYARALRDFARRHRDRCIVVHADELLRAAGEFAARTARLIDEPPRSLTDPDAVARAAAIAAADWPAAIDPAGPLATVVRATAPEVQGAYDELQQLADLPAHDSVGHSQRAGAEAQALGRIALWSELRVAAAPDRSGPGADMSSAPPSDPAARWFWDHYGGAADKALAFLAAAGYSLEGRDVADVGCGDGIIDLALVHRGRPRRLVGYDLNRTDREHLVGQARRHGVADELPAELAFESSEAVRLPVDDDSFDVVVSWSAFEHIADPVRVATEIRRVLRPGGVLFLQLWPFYRSDRGSHLWDWFPVPHHHLLEHDDDIVERMMASDVHEVGFTRYMASEFRHLNRVTLEELHRSLLAGGLRVSRVELLTQIVDIPPSLSRYELADLAVGGVQLLAV